MIFSSPVPPRNARRAFTLVELLVVMAIIAIVIALVLPAIGGSRTAAKVADSKMFCTQLSNAISTYINDENKTPGWFSESDMGSQTGFAPLTNPTKGMSEAENVMLALNGYQPSTGPGTIINPTGDATKNISIEPTLLGVPGQGNKQYFTPNKKFYAPQVTGTQQMASAPYADAESVGAQLPDLVDSFGTPILIWRQDETYITKPSANNYKFGAKDSTAGKAKFYWASNACFLTAGQTGKKARDQANPTEGTRLAYNSPDFNLLLSGVLGNVSDPYRPATLTTPPSVPRTARASVVIHSAGADGYYLGKKDRGTIDYRLNFAPNVAQAVGPTNQYTDKDGHPTNHDILSDFDDIFTQAGN